MASELLLSNTWWYYLVAKLVGGKGEDSEVVRELEEEFVSEYLEIGNFDAMM